jgi:cysteine synthase A
MLALAGEMRAAGRQGSILSLLCDAGERYLPSYHDEAWVANAFGDCSAAQRRVDAILGG